jgi:hypothetical protein
MGFKPISTLSVSREEFSPTLLFETVHPLHILLQIQVIERILLNIVYDCILIVYKLWHGLCNFVIKRRNLKNNKIYQP